MTPETAAWPERVDRRRRLGREGCEKELSRAGKLFEGTVGSNDPLQGCSGNVFFAGCSHGITRRVSRRSAGALFSHGDRWKVRDEFGPLHVP